MADDADPIEQLLDAALYVPLGLFLELRERFPELADKGRQHLTTQVNVARMVGQFAVQMGTRQVQSYLARQRADAGSAPGSASPAPASGDAAAEATAGAFTTTEPVAAAPAEPAAPAAPVAPPSADELPIPGYDTLAASQIVARLDGLQADQLAAVAAYEAAHRNRKTVLGKIEQLRKAA